MANQNCQSNRSYNSLIPRKTSFLKLKLEKQRMSFLNLNRNSNTITISQNNQIKEDELKHNPCDEVLE